jgi:hypothetical protein
MSISLRSKRYRVNCNGTQLKLSLGLDERRLVPPWKMGRTAAAVAG